jgi:hypothetical protein
MFGIVIVIEAVFFLMQLCQNDSVDIMRFMYLYATLFIHVPAIFILIVISISTLFTKKSLWRFLKTEYYMLFASLAPFVIGWFIYVVVPYLK